MNRVGDQIKVTVMYEYFSFSQEYQFGNWGYELKLNLVPILNGKKEIKQNYWKISIKESDIVRNQGTLSMNFEVDLSKA